MAQAVEGQASAPQEKHSLFRLVAPLLFIEFFEGESLRSVPLLWVCKGQFRAEDQPSVQSLLEGDSLSLSSLATCQGMVPPFLDYIQLCEYL